MCWDVMRCGATWCDGMWCIDDGRGVGEVGWGALALGAALKPERRLGGGVWFRQLGDGVIGGERGEGEGKQ